MTIRKIIKIDENLCDGCGLCVKACHEAAIEIVDGKAQLIRDDYCDGLGDCLPICPTNAITFEEREALAYNEALVQSRLEEIKSRQQGCPGSACVSFNKTEGNTPLENPYLNHLNQWPVQIKLVSPTAPFLNEANLLIAADCTAFAYGNFHEAFIKDNIVLIGCPKLDNTDYSQKLEQIINHNHIKSVTVVKMEVPCCTSLETYTEKAIHNLGEKLPLHSVTISIQGKILA